MNDIRIKFVRGEEVKYISHLDLMKTFERALRRGGLPIAYSQGFNPHPHMVFGLPLSVGVTSEAEYADFELSESINTEEFVERLNNSLPKGLNVLQARKKNVKDNIMASINSARYVMLLSSEQWMEDGVLQKRLKDFVHEQEIVVKKEGKKGTRDINIKPMLYDIELGDPDQVLQSDAKEWGKLSESTRTWLREYIKGLFESFIKPGYDKESIFCVSALLSAGSTANLKPELLITALEGFLNIPLKIIKIHRTKLYVRNGTETVEPLEDSVLN